MFHHNSFNQASFNQTSWRFDAAAVVAVAVGLGGGGGGLYSIFNNLPAANEDSAVRRQNNVILAIAVAVIGSGVLD